MCDSPNKLRDGSLVACRKCPQCRDFRVQSWVGRCIAESKTAVATTTLELTYGRDEFGNESHARASILTYSDVQKYFKQLRNRGYPARYLVTGEMGSKKGRAHWHGIVFWQKAIPTFMLDYGNNSWHRAKRPEPVEVPIEWETRFNEPCWPHGFSFWQTVQKGREKGSIMYACKYLQKDLDDHTAQSKLVMSKMPPIGAQYFIERAHKYVEERIAPQDGLYQFPGEARQKSGKPLSFMLRGKLKEIFCEEFIRRWRGLPCQGVYGPTVKIGDHYPASEYMEDYEDRKHRKDTGEYEYVGNQRYIHKPQQPMDELEWQGLDAVEIPESPPSMEVVTHAIWSDMTPYRWPKIDQRQLPVVWIPSVACGRYSHAKMQPESGKLVWMRSLRGSKKRGSIASGGSQTPTRAQRRPTKRRPRGPIRSA